jgi:hypothetical protein
MQTVGKASDLQNSRLISLMNGNLPEETGSNATASTTTHSGANRDFPWFAEYPRFGAGV